MLYYTGLPAIMNHISDMDWDRLELKESSDSVYKDWNIRKGRVIEGRDMFNIAGPVRAVADLMESGRIEELQQIWDFIHMHSYDVDFQNILLLKQNKNWDRIEECMSREYLSAWDSFLWQHEHSGMQEKHSAVMRGFLEYLNGRTDRFVLKGSAALMIVYKGDRFCEEIEIDAYSCGLPEIVEQYIKECHEQHDLVSADVKTESEGWKIIIHYGKGMRLVISADYLNKEIRDADIKHKILTYSMERLMKDKINQFISSENIADLFDIQQLYRMNMNKWDLSVREWLRSMVKECRIERVEYLLFNQELPWLDKLEFRDRITDFYGLFGGKRRVYLR